MHCKNLIQHHYFRYLRVFPIQILRMRLLMTLIEIYLNFLNENYDFALALIWSKAVTRNRILKQREITKNGLNSQIIVC